MMTVEELIESFSICTDWEERYEVLLDIGKQLPTMEESLKTQANLVKGCTSRVWMVPDFRDDKTINFIADSDAHIVRGLIAVLKIIYTGQNKTKLKSIEVQEIFQELGLEEHLTPNRRNGFYAMVEKIQSF